ERFVRRGQGGGSQGGRQLGPSLVEQGRHLIRLANLGQKHRQNGPRFRNTGRQLQGTTEGGLGLGMSSRRRVDLAQPEVVVVVLRVGRDGLDGQFQGLGEGLPANEGEFGGLTT